MKAYASNYHFSISKGHRRNWSSSEVVHQQAFLSERQVVQIMSIICQSTQFTPPGARMKWSIETQTVPRETQHQEEHILWLLCDMCHHFVSNTHSSRTAFTTWFVDTDSLFHNDVTNHSRNLFVAALFLQPTLMNVCNQCVSSKW